ncbi:alpha-glucosidase [Rhodocollybia butyracea]|uniref:Glucosidase II subunit alpha n=1 Tax=Rhodocollybia butyracea TaxID=206335 RepID=A0A9P5PNM3_9AGAR|nr:alpha-glucosidase [Rhodocollybia butyracea]
MRSGVIFGVLAALLAFPDALALKANDFKTCSKSGFCRRGRALSARAQEAQASWKSPYSLDPSSVSISPDEATVKASVKSSLYPDIKFGLELRIHDDGVVRVIMDEVDGLRKRYDEAAEWALVAEPKMSKTISWTAGKKDLRAVYGEKKNIQIVVSYDPLRVTLLRNGKEQIVLNGRGLLHMEHFRSKTVKETSEEVASDSSGEGQEVLQVENVRAWFEGESEDDWWEETFSSWTDSKPKGPESLSLDISFPNHGNVYGIPQHATNLSLPSTTGDDAPYSDPYRLYNADVFEYLASSSMSLYGSIPVMHAHSADSTVGVFNAVGSETWIDISYPTKKSTHTHWISESGIMDVFLLPGPTPEQIFTQYARLTGTTALPPHWSLGYHQCRWNYVSSDDVRTVQRRFDEEDMPVDVFWLDIEYAEDHKYFIWDSKTFPDPVKMTDDVAAIGRKMVVIVDPHLKRTDSYPIYKEASDMDILVKPKSGEGEYEGWCWSGSSSWIDHFNPASWDWWISKFKTNKIDTGFSWTQSTEDIHIWNDMNEPSIFNGPEITMPKDSIHYGGWEHRDVHNINGMLFHDNTAQAIRFRGDVPKRPFVLTRSFYAGSQRISAMWTGDNLGTWEHMAVGIKMVLANGIAGMTFAGADVGGFFGNPEPEMLIRWYQVGIFSPFFRAHAHIDTNDANLSCWRSPTKALENSVTGLPIVRPHYVMFPKDPVGFAIDDQFFIGSSGILVKPITEKEITETTVYLPDDQVYYDYFTHYAYRGSSQGNYVTVRAELHQIPVFIRGGSILPTRERPRRSSPLMKHDPFTLRVALSKSGTARGELYLDDGVTYSHQQGELVWREFVAEPSAKTTRISSKDLASANPSQTVDGVMLETYNPKNAFVKEIEEVRVEKVVVLGLSNKPKSVKVENGAELYWEYIPGVPASDKKEGTSSVLHIKDPKVIVTEDWAIVIS